MNTTVLKRRLAIQENENKTDSPNQNELFLEKHKVYQNQGVPNLIGSKIYVTKLPVDAPGQTD